MNFEEEQKNAAWVSNQLFKMSKVEVLEADQLQNFVHWQFETSLSLMLQKSRFQKLEIQGEIEAWLDFQNYKC